MSRSSFTEALDSLASRRVLLFGGKGGVGKTTISTAAALHFSLERDVVLLSTDPASNLEDLLGERPPRLTIESIDAASLYARFLGENLEAFLEIGDRGTYLDREELRRLFDLAMPGADELMGWMRVAELAEAQTGAMLVVDTAPTGHTLRMLSSANHFKQLAIAFDTMQEKHRALVRQFARRDVHDAIDQFIDDFSAKAAERRALLTDASKSAFIPVTLSEPLVIEQTLRLAAELAEMDVPFVILNRTDTDCRAAADARARQALAPRRVVDAERACYPLDSAAAIRTWLGGKVAAEPVAAGHGISVESAAPRDAAALDAPPRMLFVAGKGGVGKTSCSASIALQLANADPGGRYVVISVDPAHSLVDLFSKIEAPPNLAVEAIDTKAKWLRFRESFGDKIEGAVDALTPGGMSVSYDAEAMRSLLEIAPPGADELFAINRLAQLATDETVAGVIVDTAPTGHFLRLLDLPQTAGEWVREFMRILLRYRELMHAGSLGEELIRASRALKELDATLRSDRAAVLVVTRPERMVAAETRRLITAIENHGSRIAGVAANYVTAVSDCRCDQQMRAHELAILATLAPSVVIERRENAPATTGELLSLVPLRVRADV